MSESRSLRWLAALVLCALLAVGLALSSEYTTSNDPLATNHGTDGRQPSGPDLVGRGDAPDAQGTEAPFLRADASDPTSPPDALDDTEEAPALPPEVIAGTPDAPAAGDESDAEHMRDGAPLTADHPLVVPVIAIQERHTPELMKHPLVVGTAVGMDEHGEIAVMVLAKAEIDDLPSSLDGAPVVIFVTGSLSASRGGPGGGKKPKPSVDRTARFDSPVPIGVSTGHSLVTAGTIGCRVSFTEGGVTTEYALSNNHVYAAQNHGKEGDVVTQPGSVDGGNSPADALGTLADFEPIVFSGHAGWRNNTIDAAIATVPVVGGRALDTATPDGGYGSPKTTPLAPAVNLRVRKYGRTTGQTNGRIYGINATVTINYGGSKQAGFTGQILITPGSFSAGGDSGSLIVVQKGGNARRPVGLLYAGSSSVTIANDIQAVLDRFQVTIDGDG